MRPVCGEQVEHHGVRQVRGQRQGRAGQPANLWVNGGAGAAVTGTVLGCQSVANWSVPARWMAGGVGVLDSEESKPIAGG
jgi:hypothetical protein